MRAGQAHQRDQASNQIDIFGMLGTPGKGAKKPGDVYPPVTEWTAQEALVFEKEALGFYISGHPLDKYDRAITRITSGTIAALKEKAASGEVRLGGVVSALKLRNTKKGDRYGNFNLEDKTGFIEVITWPDTYKKCAELLGADDPIFVKGRLEVGEDRMQVIANEVAPLADAVKNQKNGFANGKINGNGEKVHLYVREVDVSAEELVRLRDTLLDYPGRSVVFLHMLGAGQGETIIELPDQVRIASSPELEATVEQLFGPRVSFHSLDS
jgi:DNA polymerase-3 subunit alpha